MKRNNQFNRRYKRRALRKKRKVQTQVQLLLRRAAVMSERASSILKAWVDTAYVKLLHNNL